MQSLAEQGKKKKKTFPHQNTIRLNKIQKNLYHFHQTIVNKSPEKTDDWHWCISLLKWLFSQTVRSFCLDSSPGPLLHDFFLQFRGNRNNAEDARVTEVMQKYTVMSTLTASFTHSATSTSPGLNLREPKIYLDTYFYHCYLAAISNLLLTNFILPLDFAKTSMYKN